MRLLALIGAKLHVLDDAEFLLESALEFDPNNFQVRTDYIGILQRRQKFSQALDQAKLIQRKELFFSLGYYILLFPSNLNFQTAIT